MPQNKKTLMGVLLSKVMAVRYEIKADAAKRLWERNKILNPAQRNGYLMKEETEIMRDGSEVTTIKLWKLIDKEVVKLEGDIKITNREGVEQGDEYSNRATPEGNNVSPIYARRGAWCIYPQQNEVRAILPRCLEDHWTDDRCRGAVLPR